MVIAIWILGALLLFSISIIIILWMAIGRLMDEYILSNPQTALKGYFEFNTEKKFPCTLLLSIKDDADFDGSVYDFSQYEEKNIIGLIECKKGTTKHHDDDEPQIALIPGQTVCKMKDGSFQWDFRGLM